MRLELSHRYYPRSLLRLLAIGFAVVAAPLVLALANAAVSVQRLADQSESTVDQAAQAARGSRLLMEEVLSMERIVRQYVILKDPGLLDDYAAVRANFKRTTSALSRLPLDEGQLAELNRAIDREQALYETLGSRPDSDADRDTLVEDYIGLSRLAGSVLNESNLLIDREIDRVRTSASDAQRALFLQLFAAIPLGLGIAALVAFLIARPIGQLDRAIRQLGAAEFAAGIQVQGPADLQYLGERLEWLRRRLADLEEQKTRFMRHVSHELKTPLTALREGASLLEEGAAGALTPQQREIVAILQANGAQLQRLIESLLDYQRAVASGGRLARRQVDVAEVVREVAEAHKLTAAARAVTLSIDAPETWALADREKLHTVIDNLLSNAVKFSPDGATVRMAVARAGSAVAIDVIDRGPGIPASDREKVFDWFFHGGRAPGARVQSSGLGLAIALELVRAHDGALELVTGEGGAHFRVTLPPAEPAR
ncbi:MAG: histidine kinase [Burkholderiales bacterium]|nr:histidine kinase [Burkholderiales bacterium]